MDGEKVELAKLNGINYGAWKFKMKLLLIQKGYWKAVTESDKEEIDQKALAVIGLAVNDEQIVHIQDAKTSKEAWSKLAAVYENSGTANKMHLQEELMTSKMEEGGSAARHIEHLRRIVGQLATLGVAVSEEQYKLTLLRSLPQSFDSLVVTLENMADDLKIEDIHARILREESRQESLGKRMKSEGDLLQAQNRSRRGISCFYCGKRGHIARKCRKRLARQRWMERPDVPQAFFANNSEEEKLKDSWFLDSGASYHMVSDARWISKGTEKKIKPVKIKLGDGTILHGRETGDVNISFQTDYGEYPITVQDVLVVQGITANLLSVGAIEAKGHSVIFKNGKCIVRNGVTGRDMLKIRKIGTTYSVTGVKRNEINRSTSVAYSSLNSPTADYWLWHARLGHIGRESLNKIAKCQILNGLPPRLVDKDDSKVCSGCAEGRMTRSPYKSLKKMYSKDSLELIHSDLCGPMSVSSKGGARYFLTFIDDHTRKTFVYFLRNKQEVPLRFLEFKRFAEKQCQKNIKGLKSDNGGEYINFQMKNILKEAGIKHYLSAPYCPQQNGVAERANRTIVEKARCMLKYSGLETSFWAEAVATSVYIKNRSLTAALGNVTPEQAWSGIKPDISHLRVFGCLAFVYNNKKGIQKWEERAKKVIFIGYQETARNYKFYDRKSRRVIVSPHAIFEEKLEKTFNTDIKPDQVENQEDNSEISSVAGQNGNEPERVEEEVGAHPDTPKTPPAQQVKLRRSTRHSTPPERLTYIHPSDDEDGSAMLMITDVKEPKSFTEAVNSAEKEDWIMAMDNEMRSLKENETWELASLPPNRKALRCKWVFRLKPKTQNQPKTYKARLVVKGFEQQYGVDYLETFAPVVKLSSVRTLLALAVHENHYVHQMDVKTAFLNGDIEEEIYMTQPEGYEDKSFPNAVCYLKKSLYGLKQAPRNWYKKIDPVLQSVGVSRSVADNGIYCGVVNDVCIRIALYVDDLIISCAEAALLQKVKKSLESHFKMKDLGAVSHCLGIEIDYSRDRGSMFLSQQRSISTVLSRFGMNNCKPVTTPMEASLKLPEAADCTGEALNVPYRSAVGSLMYIMLGTRPDLSYAVGRVSRYLEKPEKLHWAAVKRIFRYLKGTADVGLRFQREISPTLTGFSDADWANSVDRKSISGYAFLLGGSLISWASKKQATVALSSTEAETVATTEAAREAQWLIKLLKDLHKIQGGAIQIYVDNQPSMALLKREGHHGRTKHIDVKYLYVQELVEHKKVELEYCPTEEMAADFLTKPLPRLKHWRCCEALGLSRAHA